MAHAGRVPEENCPTLSANRQKLRSSVLEPMAVSSCVPDRICTAAPAAPLHLLHLLHL
jgi:hypothetical protein